MEQSMARVCPFAGIDRMNDVMIVLPKDTDMVKVFERIVAPEVMLTAVTEADPVRVFAVAFMMNVAKAVTLIPWKVVCKSFWRMAGMTVSIFFGGDPQVSLDSDQGQLDSIGSGYRVCVTGHSS
jgi:hypothetical protein